MHDCKTYEVIFDAAMKILNALAPAWKEKLLGISTDGEPTVTGRVKCVATKPVPAAYSMIRPICIVNTRADRRRRGRTSTSLPRTCAFGQDRPLILERVAYNGLYLGRSRAGRGRASTRTSLDPPPPVSAGTSPSAAPWRWGVYQPWLACVPDRTRSITASLGSLSSASWGYLLPSPIWVYHTQIREDLCTVRP